MLSIAKIARQSGYSTATISRALDPRQSFKVRPETLRKIQEVCNRLEFAPNFAARTLASGRTNTIGLITPDVGSMIGGNFSKIFTYHHARTLKRFGMNLTMLSITDTQEDIDSEMLSALRSSMVDGFVIQSSIVGKLSLQELARHHFPAVIFSMPGDPVFSNSGISTVTVDNSAAFRVMFSRLHRSGRRRIGFVGVDHIIDRLNQARTAASECGFKFGDEDVLICPHSLLRFESAFQAEHVLARHTDWLKRHDTVFFHNDQFAIGACAVLRSIGLEPGKEIAVAGYDNIMAGLKSPLEDVPGIMSIDPHLDRIGILAAKLICEQTADPGKTCKHLSVKSDFIPGPSGGFAGND